MTKLDQLANLGQSIWLDYIQRSLITSGELQALIDDGLRGITSNPSIFEKAIAGSDDYDDDLRPLAARGLPLLDIYEALAIRDIRLAADLLRPVYDQSGGGDGYVSLEANPHLAHDTEGTIAEARRLFATLDRPNVMIKVPATPEGLPAIATLIGAGININVTLIFAVDQYRAVAGAYLAGLETLARAGGDSSAGSGLGLSRVASVASFFVSRIDSAVDQKLAELGKRELQGQAAIASSKAAYGLFQEMAGSERWQRLAAQGARLQRLLWGSTSTKSPDYPDTLYVDRLIGAQTVNTVPPDTLKAFRDHGAVALTLEEGIDTARAQLTHLGAVGVDLEAITDKLLADGVASFSKSFDALLASIEGKCARLQGA